MEKRDPRVPLDKGEIRAKMEIRDHRVLLDHQVSQAKEVNKVHLARQDSKVFPVQLVLLANLERLENREYRAKLDQLVRQARGDHKVSLVREARLVPLASQDREECQERRVLTVRKVLQVAQGPLENKDQLDCRVYQATAAQLVLSAARETGVTQELED